MTFELRAPKKTDTIAVSVANFELKHLRDLRTTEVITMTHETVLRRDLSTEIVLQLL